MYASVVTTDSSVFLHNKIKIYDNNGVCVCLTHVQICGCAFLFVAPAHPAFKEFCDGAVTKCEKFCSFFYEMGFFDSILLPFNSLF